MALVLGVVLDILRGWFGDDFFSSVRDFDWVVWSTISAFVHIFTIALGRTD